MRISLSNPPPRIGSGRRCLWLAWLFVFIVINHPFTQTCHAGEHPLLDTARRHGVTAPPSEVFIVEREGGTFLVGIGQCALNEGSPRAALVARTVARALAQKALTNFIHRVTVNVKETLTEERRRVVVERPGQPPQVVETSRSKYEELISERGEGLLRGFDEVGEWMGDDGQDFFYCLAVKL
ncbi:hypothetical protein L4X63_02650 [Geomonas sp. Red32]|uniref:hypothetical protein n=1 Tax=Geomonas sp. Red32 TaxID=2912856 RepID=UPI00202CC4F1|nr:hypothetical protein [Geomonas sp. Red32]MCM0080480.1 hypothetical protein [Geomonas sp. Red32]